ncbi:uncharacterized protein [Eurosta solidaginis]|uniref:uncharacterized protein n=1 Tax=Eurosta solidaginis TaxID=178769 RepID=UPI003530F4F1
MRKYHQLTLVLISCISVIVLFTYKMENSRLKDVLTAVNFFSRKDAEELRLVNNFTSLNEGKIDFNRPMPVWQLIGNAFHAYASYWQRNELVSSGGDVLTLVTGKSGAVVNFRCSAYYNDGRLVQGKFRFRHLNQQKKQMGNLSTTTYTNYIFYCRLKNDFGEPKSIVYNDFSESDNAEHKQRLRLLKKGKSDNMPQIQLAACIDLVSFNMSSDFGRSDVKILEFFLHHYVLGINQFIVYNGDELSEGLLQKLRTHTNLQIELLPFNFPFTSNNVKADDLRELLKTDCLLRSMHKTKFVIVLEPNEFLFMNTKSKEDHSVMSSLHRDSPNSNAFVLQTYSVCMDSKNNFLTNNTFYDPDVLQPHNIYIYKPLVPTTAASTSGTANLAPSLAFAHRYIDCVHIGKDGLHRWDNALRQHFMNRINEIRLGVKELMYV